MSQLKERKIFLNKIETPCYLVNKQTNKQKTAFDTTSAINYLVIRMQFNQHQAGILQFKPWRRPNIIHLHNDVNS